MSNAVPPLSEAIIHAVCRLVDDYKDPREPSHSQLTFAIERAGLAEVDRSENPQRAGKERRLRAVLTWAHENDVPKGQLLVSYVFPLLQGCSGFMTGSPHYVGDNPIAAAHEAFRSEGWELAPNGDLFPMLLDGLTGAEAERILRSYVSRLRRNPDDSPLIVGTSKDLLEATAKHVLLERYGEERHASFPVLLGQAFIALELATPQTPPASAELPYRDIERAYYTMACAVNRLRNREGSGHGQPFLPTVTVPQARAACQVIAIVSDYMLDALKS